MMVEYNQTQREDFNEYEVLTDSWLDVQGSKITVAEPIVVGYVTKFGSKRWGFRTRKPFQTNVLATDMFKSRKEATETCLESLVLNEPTPQEDVIDLKALKKMFPLPKIKNNKKRTRGRMIQYVPVKNKEGKVVSSKKIIHRKALK